MESDREIWGKVIMRMKNGNALDKREIQIEGIKLVGEKKSLGRDR